MPTLNIKDIPESKIVKLVDLSEDSINKIAEAVIQKITNAEPVKHGHWVMSNGDYEWECSSCGRGLSDNRTAYCYDCGAKMDGVTDVKD